MPYSPYIPQWSSSRVVGNLQLTQIRRVVPRDDGGKRGSLNYLLNAYRTMKRNSRKSSVAEDPFDRRKIQ